MERVEVSGLVVGGAVDRQRALCLGDDRIGRVVVGLAGVHARQPPVGLLRQPRTGAGEEAVDQRLLRDARGVGGGPRVDAA